MKMLRLILPIMIGVAGSLGILTNAHAAAYAKAYNNIFGLTITSTDANGEGGPVFVPLQDFTDFTATSTASANRNGSGDPANPANSDIGGGPVDASPAFGLNSNFNGPAPVNNDMTPVGQVGDYSRADAQVSTTALSQSGIGQPVTATGNTTQAWNIAEGFVPADGNADALATNSSETGLNTTISLDQPAIFHFSFNADPSMQVDMDTNAAGGTANANLDVTFTITRAGGSSPVFEWTPDGNIGSGIIGGTETSDGANLNGSIEVTTPGDSATFDPTGDNSEGNISPGTFASFAASTAVLEPGIYTIALDMSENVNVRTAESALIEIEKTPDLGDNVIYGPGDTAYFDIKVTSLGPGTAVNVMIDDDLPTNGDTLMWSVASENPNLGACTIDANQHLNCAIGDMDQGEMFTVRVETTIPLSAVALALAGTDFNATDGNLLLDNSEIPSGVGAPAMDLKDWETFAGSIDCGTNAGCVFDTPSGQLDNSYTQGAKEDHRNPAIDFGSIPPSKDDLLRWYYVNEFLNSDSFLYLAWVRSNELATATIDFELNQSGDLESNGVNPVRTEGDVLIVYDFRGGRVDRLDLLRWLEDTSMHTDADCETNNGSVADGCWGNIIDLLGSGIAEGAVNFYDNGTNKPGDDGYPVYDPIVGETLEKLHFGEAAINLTAALGEGEECVNFAQAFVKSRASSSFGSELKDFISPVPAQIGTCVEIPNTAFGDGTNVPEVFDDGAFQVKP